jgi:nitrile hydratase accessory protein
MPIPPSSFQSMPGRVILSRPEDLTRAVAEVAPIPRGEDGAPVFREPWEAQAFATAIVLHERGLFTWTEWAAALSAAIKRAQAAGDCDDGSTYYRHWLSAIEQLVGEKGIASQESLAERRQAWDRAARATPHGRPILLENDPLH